MTDELLIHWLADELATVLMIPITSDRRLAATRALISTFAVKFAAVPNLNRSAITDVLDTWVQTKRIDVFPVPRDDETIDWLEEIVGTIEGIIEGEA